MFHSTDLDFLEAVHVLAEAEMVDDSAALRLREVDFLSERCRTEAVEVKFIYPTYCYNCVGTLPLFQKPDGRSLILSQS